MATTYTKVKKSYYELGFIPELLKLMKPRVMSLVIFTCAVGLLTAPTSVSFQQSVIGILIVAFGAGAAGAVAPVAAAPVVRAVAAGRASRPGGGVPGLPREGAVAAA